MKALNARTAPKSSAPERMKVTSFVHSLIGLSTT